MIFSLLMLLPVSAQLENEHLDLSDPLLTEVVVRRRRHRHLESLLTLRH